ncbi:MAG: TetR/AcrR family transcriptional regulator [Sulfitobacter sp.]
MKTTRLTPEIWLNAGFVALQTKGPTALAAEPLARQIGTTKGSFYWHFKDVPAFHAALIESWRARAMADLLHAVAATTAPDQRLRDFGRNVLDDRTETALRVWAHSNLDVTQALNSLDSERLTYLSLLLRELGLANPNFARALQAALIGLPQLSQDAKTRNATFDTLVDTVLAL